MSASSAPLVFLPLESRSWLAVSELAGCPFVHSVPLGVCQSGTVVLLLSLVNLLRETEGDRMKWVCWFHWCTGPGGCLVRFYCRICSAMDSSVIQSSPWLRVSMKPWACFTTNTRTKTHESQHDSATAHQFIHWYGYINIWPAAKSSGIWTQSPSKQQPTP